MKGRFFFDPTKQEVKKEVKDQSASNSILIRKGRTEIFWDEEENKMSASSEPQQQPKLRKRVITHQKICQTETPLKGEIGIQVETVMTDFCMQVGPLDLQPPAPVVEEKPRDFDDRRGFDLDRRGFDNNRGFGDLRANFDDRRDFDDRRGFDNNRGFDERRGFDTDRRVNPLNDDRRLPNDRLDWSMRETFDHSAKLGDSNDLRWSLNNQMNVRDKPMNVSWGNNNFSANDNLLGLLAGAVGGAGLPLGTAIDTPNVLDNYLRQEMEARRAFDSFGPRNMDNFGRAGDLDNFGSRMDARGGDMDNFGSRNMDGRGGIGGGGGDMNNFGRGGMEMFGDRGNLPDARDRLMDRNKGNKDARDRGMDSMRDGNKGQGNFNRNMGMDRDRGDKPSRGPGGGGGGGKADSPKRQNDDNDELEIIEERVNEPSWKNQKGPAGPANKKPNVAKRGFRGRLGGFRQ